jgi:transcription termination factor Rho
MAEEQLERSILEGKERDELHAIASAMSLKATARTKKSDIIDLILEATGVDAPILQPAGVVASGTSEPSAGERAAETGASEKGTSENGASTSPRTRRPRSTRGAETTATPLSVDDGPSEEDSPVVTEDVRPAPKFVFDGGEETPIETVAHLAKAGPRTRVNGARLNGEKSGAVEGVTVPAEGESTPAETADGAPSQESTPPGQTTNPTPTRERETRQHSGQTHQQNQHGGGQSRQQANHQEGPGDPANRRGRRRRGRDRERSDLPNDTSSSTYSGELVPVKGLLDLRDEGYGFLRTAGYLASQHDVYVSVSQARRFSLRKGDAIEGACRPAGPSEKYPALVRIDLVSGLTPDEARARPRFEDLTPLFPDQPLTLETADPTNMTARIVDLISPIGKGQRGLIVSPPKAGKTTVLKQLAHSIEANHPEVHLIVLLVDERPEEVTDMRRSVKGEVVASTFDRPADEHTSVSELTIERAKRLVEVGRDVVIVLDGITRLARAYNLAQPATGRVMSGGVDSGAL